MAPTEILARQHFETLSPLMARLGLTCALLTGSTRARERRETLADVYKRQANFIPDFAPFKNLVCTLAQRTTICQCFYSQNAE